MIAMALACRPKLVIADEPTTALDVTIQAQILELLVALQRERGTGLVLITHDMGVVAETAERVSVHYAGQKIEEQPVGPLFCRSAPSLYGGAARGAAGTRAHGRLLPSIPGTVPASATGRRPASSSRAAASPPTAAARRCRRARADRRLRALPLSAQPRTAGRPSASRGPRGDRMTATAILAAHNLARHYLGRARSFQEERASCRRSPMRASRSKPAGPSAIVGESGSGKSTLARLVAMIERAFGRRARHRRHGDRRRRCRDAGEACAARADRVPEPLWLAQSAPEDRRRARTSRSPSTGPDMSARERARSGKRDAAAGRPQAANLPTATRICSPAASAGASPSPAR